MSKKSSYVLAGGIIAAIITGPFMFGVGEGLLSALGVIGVRDPCAFTFDDFKKEIYGDQSFLKTDYCGGNTPEETARMFTAALKAGDFDRAVKYSIPGQPFPERYSTILSERYSTTSAAKYFKLLDALVVRGEKKCRQGKYFDFKDAPAAEMCDLGFDNEAGADKELPSGQAWFSMVLNPYTHVWQISMQEVVVREPFDPKRFGE